MKCGWNHNVLAQRQADDVHYAAFKEKHGEIDGYSLHFEEEGFIEMRIYHKNKIIDTLKLSNECATFHDENGPL